MTLIIAELGINHNGDLGIAKQLIDAAKAAGADAVKFQKRTIEIVYTPEQLAAPRTSPWGTTNGEQKRHLEFGRAEYDEIDAYCQAVGMPWFASAWDLESLAFLTPYDLPYNKVASAMLTNGEFVDAVAREQKLTFVSTGMATESDLFDPLLRFAAVHCPVVLMHTVSTYPTPDTDLNLACLATLRQLNSRVGYSGHEVSPIPSIIAAALGAEVIERHLTLDRSMYGSDQAASLEPRAFASMVDAIRRIPGYLGDGVKRWMPGEADVAKKLRYWESP